MDGGALLATLAAVEIRRRDAVLSKAIDLILHQRDQRRDDDGETTEVDRRRLIAERLAAARGEYDETVASVEHGAHGVILQRTKAVEAPHAPECLEKGKHLRRS